MSSFPNRIEAPNTKLCKRLRRGLGGLNRFLRRGRGRHRLDWKLNLNLFPNLLRRQAEEFFSSVPGRTFCPHCARDRFSDQWQVAFVKEAVRSGPRQRLEKRPPRMAGQENESSLRLSPANQIQRFPALEVRPPAVREYHIELDSIEQRDERR